MLEEDFNDQAFDTENSSRSDARRTRGMDFDPTPYMHHLADMSLSDEQKTELLETMWQIMLHFVDLGLGITPMQQAMDKSIQPKTTISSEFADVVKSKPKSKNAKKRKLRPATKLSVER